LSKSSTPGPLQTNESINHRLPTYWLVTPYEAAIREIVQPALVHLRHADGDAEVRSLLAVLAHAKGQPSVGTIALWTEDERREALGEL
jgi:hypothetical protein